MFAAAAYYAAQRAELEQGARVLWPEREDYLALMIMRQREGRGACQAEKQNEPIDPEVCVFSEERFHYWDDEHDDVERLVSAVGDGYYIGGCDPSLGRHRLVEIAEDLGSLSKEGRFLLDDLATDVLWRGRYPAPMEQQGVDPRVDYEMPQFFHDFESIPQFLAPLFANLYAAIEA